MTGSGAETSEGETSGEHQPSIRLDETDTVVTMLEDAEAGDVVRVDDEHELELAEAVPFGHKVATVAHEPGDEIRKYGEVIGVAMEPIAAGAWVHTHNCDSVRGKAEGVRSQ